MKVLFKLDSRLTKGLHMGERWISPPSYAATQAGSVFTVHARARALDPGGPSVVNPTWSSSEPDMVAFTPDQGSQVEITVLRAGRSSVTVTDGHASKTLVVNAVQRSGAWQVDISQ